MIFSSEGSSASETVKSFQRNYNKYDIFYKNNGTALDLLQFTPIFAWGTQLAKKMDKKGGRRSALLQKIRT